MSDEAHKRAKPCSQPVTQSDKSGRRFMKKLAMTLTVMCISLIMAGCGNRFWQDTKEKASDTYDFMFDSAPTARSFHETSEIPIIELNHQAADVLFSNVGQYELSKFSAVFHKPFANQVEPSDKSVFGTVMMRQVSDRLVQHGLLITDGEPNHTDYEYSKTINPADYKSMNAKTREKLPPLAAMLNGNYVIGDNYIYMSASITRLVDNAVISAHNWTLPITDNVRQMLPQLKLDNGLEPTVKTRFE